ncbi:MAG: ammonium transporter [Thermoleophilia bacterium]|nr:ammonium transporter [Thermoleophilia bacterium]
MVGLRVGAREEIEGLDIHEHGQWGYPEQFSTASVTTSTDSPPSG